MLNICGIDKYLLINDDCFSALKDIPDHSIDLILTDPPYNIAKYSTGNLKFDWRSDINNDLAEWDLTELHPEDLIGEFKRILKPQGNIFIFCSYNIIGEYHKVFDPEFDTYVIADHSNQEFSALKYVSVGAEAYVDYGSYQQKYVCTKFEYGHNDDGTLLDADYNVIYYYDYNDGGITCYTCNGNSYNIILVCFQPVYD